MRSRHVDVLVQLDQIRANAEAIRRQTGKPLIAVIKADAYGHGAARVADALAAVAEDFAYFSLAEAREVGRSGLVLGPPEDDPVHYRELGLRPTIFTRADADRFAGQRIAMSVDLGMQRFGAAEEDLTYICERGIVTDIHAHAASPEALARFRTLLTRHVPPATLAAARLHVAATALLGQPEAWLGAVRPGAALYRAALRVTSRLISTRATYGPAGYTGFSHPHIGIILAGYSNGLRRATVLVHGRRQRLLEVGMNSSFVGVEADACAGDEVVLLGDTLTAEELSGEWQCRPHEIMCRYSSIGVRRCHDQPPAPDCAAPGEVAATRPN